MVNQQKPAPWGKGQGCRDSRQQDHRAGPAAKGRYCDFPVARNTDILTMKALWMQQRKQEGFPGVAAEVICSEGCTGVPAPEAGSTRLADRKPGSSMNSWRWDVQGKKLSILCGYQHMDINDTCLLYITKYAERDIWLVPSTTELNLGWLECSPLSFSVLPGLVLCVFLQWARSPFATSILSFREPALSSWRGSTAFQRFLLNACIKIRVPC